MKDETCDNIKSHKKVGLHSLCTKHNFGKTTKGGQIDYPGLNKTK